MKNYKVINPSNYDYTEQQYEINKQKSLTIPDQALSIKDILTRYARGLDVEAFKPIYDDDDISLDDYLPNPLTMDLAERQEYAEQVREELTYLNQNINSTESVGLPEAENVAVNNAKEEM